MDGIISKAKNGDQDAIGQLYKDYQKRGISLALKYVKTEENAEDMYQDSFIKAMNHLNSFDDTKEFGPWLNTIIVNTCKNFLEKKKAVNFSDISDEETEFVDSISNTDTDIMPEESLDKAELVNIMDKIIGALPDAQRQAVALFYYNEMSVKEIANLQGISEDTVKSRLNYARKKVGVAIEEYQKKNGIKLYSITIIPLAFFIYYKSGTTAYACTLAEISQSAGVEAGKKAGTTIAKNAGTTAVKSVSEAATQNVVKNTIIKKGIESVSKVGFKSALKTIAIKGVATKTIITTTVAAIGVGAVTTTAAIEINRSINENKYSIEAESYDGDSQYISEGEISEKQEADNQQEISITNIDIEDSILPTEDDVDNNIDSKNVIEDDESNIAESSKDEKIEELEVKAKKELSSDTTNATEKASDKLLTSNNINGKSNNVDLNAESPSNSEKEPTQNNSGSVIPAQSDIQPVTPEQSQENTVTPVPNDNQVPASNPEPEIITDIDDSIVQQVEEHLQDLGIDSDDVISGVSDWMSSEDALNGGPSLLF